MEQKTKTSHKYKLIVHSFEIDFKGVKRAAYFAKLIGTTLPQIYKSLTRKQFPIKLYASITLEDVPLYDHFPLNENEKMSDYEDDEDSE